MKRVITPSKYLCLAFLGALSTKAMRIWGNSWRIKYLGRPKAEKAALMMAAADRWASIFKLRTVHDNPDEYSLHHYLSQMLYRAVFFEPGIKPPFKHQSLCKDIVIQNKSLVTEAMAQKKGLLFFCSHNGTSAVLRALMELNLEPVILTVLPEFQAKMTLKDLTNDNRLFEVDTIHPQHISLIKLRRVLKENRPVVITVDNPYKMRNADRTRRILVDPENFTAMHVFDAPALFAVADTLSNWNAFTSFHEPRVQKTDALVEWARSYVSTSHVYEPRQIRRFVLGDGAENMLEANSEKNRKSFFGKAIRDKSNRHLCGL